MSGVSTVTTKGQVTIPEPLRRKFNISVGDKIYFEPEPSGPEIKIKKITSVTDQLAGSLSSSVPYADMETVRVKVGRELGKQYMLDKMK